MWDQIKEKISCLKAYDKQHAVFGAESHRYEFYPLATEAQVGATELKLGCKLPAALKDFYMLFGNGGVGPIYGICPLDKLDGYKPGLPYQLASELVSDGRAAMAPNVGQNCVAVDLDILQGLLLLMDEGCGYETCMVTSGDSAGMIVEVSCDGYISELKDQTLLDMYQTWLDSNLLSFSIIEVLVKSKLGLNEIISEIEDRFSVPCNRSMIISYIDGFFIDGTGLQQSVSYEKQLADYRQRLSNSSFSWSITFQQPHSR